MKNKMMRLASKLTATAMVVSMFATVMPAAAAEATAKQDVMTRQKISTAANHTISFTINNGIIDDGSTLTVSFDTDFNTSSIVYTDVDVNGSSSGEKTIGTDCNATDHLSAVMSADVLTLTVCTGDNGDFTSGETVTIEVGTNATTGTTGINQIVNPGTVQAATMSLGGTGSVTGDWLVYIVDDDQVTVNAHIDSTMTFDLDTSIADTDSATPYSVALGTLSSSAVTTSDGSSINSIWVDLTHNATGGAVVTVVSANGRLESTSVSADFITSDSGDYAAGAEHYGICVKNSTATTGTFVATATFGNGSGGDNSANCGYGAGADSDMGALTTSAQNILTNTGTLYVGRAEILVKAAISSVTPAHPDYADTLTFIATATF